MFTTLMINAAPQQDLTMYAYMVYLPIALGLTWYVAHQLFKNSIVYMNDIFQGRLPIATATNALFKMGFYLLNIGFALFILEINYDLVRDARLAIEVLSYKIGGFCIYLGVMLFLNMYLFFRGKRIARQKAIHQAVLNIQKLEGDEI
jgi:hypothetical protein